MNKVLPMVDTFCISRRAMSLSDNTNSKSSPNQAIDYLVVSIKA